MPRPSSLAGVDDPLEWASFSRSLRPVGPSPGPEASDWESTVVFAGITCAACALNIEHALLKVPGVASAQVSAASHRGRVRWSSRLTMPSVWMQAAEAAGHPAVPAQDAPLRDLRLADSRLMLWRWLVAGLCMMQVMMYATPVYFVEPGDLLPEYLNLLRWASWVLCLPVLFFSCGPFFRGAWRDLLQRRIGMDLPVALGIAITFAVSTAGTFDPAGPFGVEVFFDSLTMFVFFLLTGRWLELRLRDRTAGALESLINRLPEQVQRRTPDGNFEAVSLRRLAVGDVLRVLPGQSFAADGVIAEGHTQVDEALLTGESRPLSRGPGEQVLAGSHNLGAVVQMQVQTLGDGTRFAQIVRLMAHASADRPPLARLADRLASPFLFAVLLVAALAAAWWWPTDPARALMVAVAVLVVSCPCALSLATPAALLAAAGRLARQGVLVRRLAALEALARADTVVLDKTGTLTHDRMVLGETRVRSGVDLAQVLAMAGALARESLHPASRSLAQAAPQGWMAREVSEVSGQGVQGQVRLQAIGATAMQGDWTELRLGRPQFCGLPSGEGEGSMVCVADAQGWLASFELIESVRADAMPALTTLRGAGLHLMVLSGDAPAAVKRVAERLGVADARGGCSPQDKLDAVRALQAQGRCVVMVGDGLNDAPVLAGADASFAMGQALPLAQARADFVLLSPRLYEVMQTILMARRTMAVVRQNLGWALGYNLLFLPLAVSGHLSAWLAGLGMAGSSLVVVLNALRLSRQTLAQSAQPGGQPSPKAPHTSKVQGEPA